MAHRLILQDFASAHHDHNCCVVGAMARAEQVCRARGERFTPLRREVLALVWSSHKPVKAYELLSTLSQTRGKMAPPSVYRVLDFLQNAGLVHRLESINCYIGCGDPTREHQGQFLICECCGSVAEFADMGVMNRFETTASRVGFKMNVSTIEIFGLCQNCQ
ncbi:MAG: Fur family transcriptional regulator [Gammaproteobacteria bacterium]|nr:Fur family transcriptional regulator [Gammaproteobacteria bacterium]